MSEVTGGHPERSPRFRDLRHPPGSVPNFATAFVADAATLGGR